MIKKLLIANRGEIAIRIIRTCKEMGIKTVAVYSQADAESLHVQLADEAVCIGAPRAVDSYLNMNNIIQAACSTGCDAIHPGFGFLSENPDFARLVEQCGLIFVGPSADIIEKLGNKSTAKRIMKEAGVPVVPGSKDVVETVEEGLERAKEITYPLIIKASAGGGGRGMRIVHSEDEFVNAFNSAKSEAKACFNNDEVYMEKFIEDPKHIEVQLIGDHFGNVIHLYERDCSFQRRNQKLVEEAPCFTLSDDIRTRMTNDAVKACKAVGYDSVGTIEFLLDKHGNYYFMEMNTRIQVEHPITEMICNIDIVKQQIKIAENQRLNIKQEDVKINGYAMECRINAENPAFNFAPSPGKITNLYLPSGGVGLRVDSAVYPGYTIPPYYDSMIAKIIVHGENRFDALMKMQRALYELEIDGVMTNSDFQLDLISDSNVIAGDYDTAFLMETFLPNYQKNQ